MNKNYIYWTIPLVLFGAAASAEEDKFIYLDSTNRLTLSMRFGLNISAKFKGIGNNFTSSSIYGNSRTTPNGDPYNYDNGYVLTDISGNGSGYTSYWGYDNASQVDSVAPDTIAFNKTTATGIPSQGSDKDTPPGVELTYDRQLGENENWHHLRYGIEGAANYMKLSMNNNISTSATLVTTTTAYSTGGATPPAAPFQGTFDGFGYMVLEVPPTFPTTAGPTTVTPGATFTSRDDFDADIWGFRFGPYLELPLTKKIDLRLSGGFAVGLIYGNENWNETLTPPLASTLTASGDGKNFDVLWGGYLSLDATYQFSEHWGLDVGAQFQDLGKFDHSYQGRQVELDLSKSLFVEAGVSYSF